MNKWKTGIFLDAHSSVRAMHVEGPSNPDAPQPQRTPAIANFRDLLDTPSAQYPQLRGEADGDSSWDNEPLTL